MAIQIDSPASLCALANVLREQIVGTAPHPARVEAQATLLEDLAAYAEMLPYEDQEPFITSAVAAVLEHGAGWHLDDLEEWEDEI